MEFQGLIYADMINFCCTNIKFVINLTLLNGKIVKLA